MVLELMGSRSEGFITRAEHPQTTYQDHETKRVVYPPSGSRACDWEKQERMVGKRTANDHDEYMAAFG